MLRRISPSPTPRSSSPTPAAARDSSARTPPVYSDAKGAATLADLTAGYWTVIVEANGLLSSENRRVAVRRGEITPLPVRLTRPARIAGTVTLADGGAVAGISVVARG